VIDRLELLVFRRRPLTLALFVVATFVLAISATGTRIEASFSKRLPFEHTYMRTYDDHAAEFGGADRILVALMARDGDMFTRDFFTRLEAITDAVFFLPGVDRTRVHSLFTPNVRFSEVVEDGIVAGNVIPADFTGGTEDLNTVRENILKAGIVGRLVANDFSGAIVSAQLMEFDPRTGEQLDYVDVAHRLEEDIGRAYEDNSSYDVHIIGFAKIVGDIANGAHQVIGFFGVTVLVTVAIVYLYSQSLPFTLIPILCSLIAVVWQLGIVAFLGLGFDPMSVLVPFLVFAIGVSHAVQMVSATRAELFFGHDGETSARRAFRRLLVPGTTALASDTIGFLMIILIAIRMIQEMAVIASIGVAAIILTNLVLLPVLLSYVRTSSRYRARIDRRARQLYPVWRTLSRTARPDVARLVIGAAAALLVVGLWKSVDVEIGDLQSGVPELRPDSTYNRDSAAITSKFNIGVDSLGVVAEGIPQACIDFETMHAIDDFEWYIREVAGVHSVRALPDVAKRVHAGWNEGSMKWRVVPRNQDMLIQSVAQIPASSGLFNGDCSAIPVTVFTTDHKATTINRIIDAVEKFRAESDTRNLDFRLALGNVGVMAATNDVVAAAQFPILAYVFVAVVALCVLGFRSIIATLCIVVPLALVSLLTYAFMASLEIGLKVSTLPVVALGIGIGVDYGIYVYSRLKGLLETGEPLMKAYEHTLRISGSGVVLTGITLSIGVATWIFSPLQFQADMGRLLTFMFVLNMIGAIVLLPALACWLLRAARTH